MRSISGNLFGNSLLFGIVSLHTRKFSREIPAQSSVITAAGPIGYSSVITSLVSWLVFSWVCRLRSVQTSFIDYSPEFGQVF
jgi:hypothetical protein